jgi:hypothetical protein
MEEQIYLRYSQLVSLIQESENMFRYLLSQSLMASTCLSI